MIETPTAGMLKILEKGTADPEAVRFHVPRPEGGWRSVTWGEVLERARRIALWLDAEGVGKGVKVAVYATTRVEWAWTCAALEACRAVFVPVYFSNTAEQTEYVVGHSDAEVLFTEVALLPRVLERWEGYGKVRRVVVWDLDDEAALEAAGAQAAARRGRPVPTAEVTARTVALSEVDAAGAAREAEEPGRLEAMLAGIDPEDVAAIIYTSGTTGVPKGVVLTIHNLLATTASWFSVLEPAIPPAGARRDILWLPVSHMSGWGILGQGTMFEYETWLSDPWNLLRILPEVRPTMLFSVPAYWEKMYALARQAGEEAAAQHEALRQMTGGTLSFLLSGGAGLKREVKDFFEAAGIHLIEGYGLTECSPNVTMNGLDDFDFESVGKPMPGVEVRLADDGEILVKGENVFQGYYKQPEATAACLTTDGWFMTGDLGRWRPGGFLQIVGRKKEIIVTAGGKNISPVGIESRFVGNPFVEHVVVYGDERKYLVALVTLVEPTVRAFARSLGIEEVDFASLVARPEVGALVQQQVDAVNAELASYETIKRFWVYPGHLSVEAGHITPSLKVRRAKVWEAFAEQYEALYA